jgi:hypothetical protein
MPLLAFAANVCNSRCATGWRTPIERQQWAVSAAVNLGGKQLVAADDTNGGYARESRR